MTKTQLNKMAKIARTTTEAFLTRTRMNAANWQHASVGGVAPMPVPRWRVHLATTTTSEERATHGTVAMEAQPNGSHGMERKIFVVGAASTASTEAVRTGIGLALGTVARHPGPPSLSAERLT